MNNNNNGFLFVILGVFIGYFVFKIIDALLYTRVVTKTVETPQSAEENDFVKWVMECRNITIEMAAHCLRSAWFIPSETELSTVQTDLDNMVTMLAYQNYLFRWYFDWKHKKMILGFTTNDQNKHSIERKTFKIKGGCLNFEEFYMYCVKLQKKYFQQPQNELLNLDEDSLKSLLEKVVAESKDIPASIQEFWAEWKQEIFDKGADKEEMVKFIYFTLALKNKEVI